jgi:hypothetical protein
MTKKIALVVLAAAAASILAACAKGAPRGALAAASASPSEMASPTVLMSAGADSEGFAPPPPGSSPQFTASQAIAAFQKVNPQWVIPSDATTQLGSFNEANSGGSTFSNVLAYGINYSYCLAPLQEMPASYHPSCDFWLFIDANTGRMIQAGDAPGMEPSPSTSPVSSPDSPMSSP